MQSRFSFQPKSNGCGIFVSGPLFFLPTKWCLRWSATNARRFARTTSNLCEFEIVRLQMPMSSKHDKVVVPDGDDVAWIWGHVRNPHLDEYSFTKPVMLLSAALIASTERANLSSPKPRTPLPSWTCRLLISWSVIDVIGSSTLVVTCEAEQSSATHWFILVAFAIRACWLQ